MKLNNKGNSLPLMVIGVVLIVVGIAVGIVTATGYVSHFLPSEVASASYPFIIGIVIAVFLVALGLFFCWTSARE